MPKYNFNKMNSNIYGIPKIKYPCRQISWISLLGVKRFDLWQSLVNRFLIENQKLKFFNLGREFKIWRLVVSHSYVIESANFVYYKPAYTSLLSLGNIKWLIYVGLCCRIRHINLYLAEI